VGRDRQAQDAVPEEGETLIRLGALANPRGVRERLALQVFRELIEEGF
jgi:hypothetical protein